jgi:hypothetical protein
LGFFSFAYFATNLSGVNRYPVRRLKKEKVNGGPETVTGFENLQDWHKAKRKVVMPIL